MMEAYQQLAYVYDLFMEAVPYQNWANHILRILKENQNPNRIIADIGCGTGRLTTLLAAGGYDLIGIDASTEMLEMAREQSDGFSILYLQQVLPDFELYGTVGAIVCTCDTINYLTKEDEVHQFMHWVNNYLEPGGLFWFDFHEPAYYEELGDTVLAEDHEGAAFIWENSYDPQTAVNEYQLSLFVEGEDGRYDRAVEYHRQRGYTTEQMKQWVSEAGLKVVSVTDGVREGLAEPGERVFILARECSKAMKLESE
ncbi:MAG: class I SAM-dependent methyltransferase [Lachnospiraceae bacterium]|nr:class I SAM-dependent methyltransferase [Lachnospiraceae bacterium]